MTSRNVGLHFAIDTNRINSRQRLPHMNRLERWRDNGVIEILMPEAAHSEARQGSDPKRRWKASLQIFSLNTWESADEAALRHKVSKILAPSRAPDRNTLNDIDILVIAHKYFCTVITADGASRRQPGGMLGYREQLGLLGIKVVTDAEAVAMVEYAIRRRDEAEINLARVQGRAVSPWVGRDA